jgi:hypothetical protein
MAFPRAIGSKLPAARQPTRNLTPPRAESLTRRPAATGPKGGATEKLQVDGRYPLTAAETPPPTK